MSALDHFSRDGDDAAFLAVSPALVATNMEAKAEEASLLLARMANPQRLRILCLMIDQERSVNWLVEQTGLAQPTVSQHLKKLRDAGIVRTRRDAQTIYYALDDNDTLRVLTTLYGIFCSGSE